MFNVIPILPNANKFVQLTYNYRNEFMLTLYLQLYSNPLLSNFLKEFMLILYLQYTN